MKKEQVTVPKAKLGRRAFLRALGAGATVAAARLTSSKRSPD
jgi:hypothetical protein